MKKYLYLLAGAIFLFTAQPQTAQAKKPCPVFKLIKPKPGCKYIWYVRNGCRYPKLICKKPCPVFRLANPGPGCKYVWYTRNGCRYPRKVCKPYCTKMRCKYNDRRCTYRKRICVRKAKSFNLAGVKRIRSICKRIRTANGLWRCLCSWANRRAPEHVILRGMRACYLKQCDRYRCTKPGYSLCIPHAPGTRCVRRPCCKKLICVAPRVCRRYSRR